MSELDARLRNVLLATVRAHGTPDAQGSRRVLLHMRSGGMQQGVKHHAWPDAGPAVDREDLEALRQRELVEVTPQPNSWAFRPTEAGYALARKLDRAESAAGSRRDNGSMGTPSRRALLRWFHALEDSDDRSEDLRDGWRLTQAAQADRVIRAEDVDGFAALVLEMADEDLIGFDHAARGLQQFGADAFYELQQATNLRSTPKGREWLRETPSAGASITFGEGATVGQVAGRDITNYVSFSDVLDAAEARLEEMEADPEQREAARGWLRALGDRAGEVATGAGARVAGQALAGALNLPP